MSLDMARKLFGVEALAAGLWSGDPKALQILAALLSAIGRGSGSLLEATTAVAYILLERSKVDRSIANLHTWANLG